MRWIKTIVPHSCIVLSLLFITLLIVDKVNGAMNFIGNPITKGLLMLFSLLVIAAACLLIHENRKSIRNRYKRMDSQREDRPS